MPSQAQRPVRRARTLSDAKTVATGSSPRPATAPRPDSTVVVDALAEQLVAAADAEDRRARGGAGGQRAVQAGAAQPLEVLDRRLGPGHDEQVGALDVGGRAREAHPHPRLGRERVDVGEVAHPAQAQDGDVDGVAVGRGLGAAGLQRERVLDVHPQVLDEREHAERGAAGELGQPLDAGGQDRLVAAELVDHEAGDVGLVVGVEQRQRAVERGEDAAAVDVGDHQRRETGGAGQAQVGEVVLAQVDLGGAARRPRRRRRRSARAGRRAPRARSGAARP